MEAPSLWVGQTIDKYTLDKFLGRGAFGEVLRGIDVETGQHYAVKIIEKANLSQKDLANVEREFVIMQSLNHPNLVKLYEALNTTDYIFLILEYVAGGDLFAKYRSLTDQQVLLYTQQIVDGIAYMHKNKFYHRDIKLENILLTEDGTMCKITDFGLSVESCGIQNTIHGTVLYAAPEIRHPPYDPGPLDIWAIGVVIYLLLKGKYPFGNEVQSDAMEIFKQSEACRPDYSGINDSARDLLSKIFVADAQSRMTFDQIREHPWFARDYVYSAGFPPDSGAQIRDIQFHSPDVFDLFGKVAQIEVNTLLVGDAVPADPVKTFVLAMAPKQVNEAITKYSTDETNNLTLVKQPEKNRTLVTNADEEEICHFNIIGVNDGTQKTVLSFDQICDEDTFGEFLQNVSAAVMGAINA